MKNMRRHYRPGKVRKIIGIIILVIIGVMVFGGVVMLLWNNLMPPIFHLPVITFWQALGLLILTKILFSGFRGGGPRGRWKEKLNDRWRNMTPEEREKLKQEWGRRCRGPFRPDEPFTADERHTSGTGAAEEKQSS
jgi:Ca2+/H+ antiporter, TMEM165/GDT1 family